MPLNRSPRLKATLLATAIALASSHIPFASAQQATTNAIAITIPAGSLDGALNTLASQSGLTMTYSPNLVRGLSTKGLQGELKTNDALDQLLTGIGVGYRFVNESTVTLYKRKANEPTELDTIRIIGTQQSRYEFGEAESATGFIADVDDLPRTVQVLPEQLIIDQNADDLTDILVNAAGVTRAHGFGGAETQVNIRGFENNRIFVDGNPVSTRYNIDVADIESAEVILGPASILHGQVSPGGLVNIVTKKPQEESATSLQLEFDEHGKQKLSLDSTGPLSESLQYRLVFSGEDSDSYREVNTTEGSFDGGRESYSLSPSFSFTPNESNIFTLRLNYTKQELPIDRGTVAVDDGSGNLSIANIPRDRRLGSEFDQRDSEENRIQLDWDYYINDSWTNKLKIGFYEKEFDDYQARPIVGFTAPPTLGDLTSVLMNATGNIQSNGLLGRTLDSNLDVTERDIFISDSLVGDYEISGIDNTLYIGANYYQRDIKVTDGFSLLDVSGIFGPGVFFPELSIIDINSSTQPANTRSSQTPVSNSDATFEEYGLSIQNLSHLTNHLHTLLGVRYDHFKVDNDITTILERQANGAYIERPSQLNIKSSNDNISGQAGVLYDLTDNISIYGSYSESFTPNYPDVTAGVVSGEGDIEPEEASQYEIGVKSSFIDNKLRVSLSAYDLTRENVLRFENLEARLNGEERTKGIDISSSMQFLPGLNVLASYSYFDSEIVDDNNDARDNEGNTPFSIPDNKARLWGSYEQQKGYLAGLGFGLGAEYVGSRYGDDANTFELPSYTIFDTAVWGYVRVSDSKIRLQAGVKNITDKTYYPANGSGSALRINVGEPRTAYITARLEF